MSPIVRMMPVSVPPVMIHAFVFIVARIRPSAKVWKYLGRSLISPRAEPVTLTWGGRVGGWASGRAEDEQGVRAFARMCA